LTREPEEQLVAYFVEQFRVDVPVLTQGAISVSADEMQVDVSQDPNRMVFDRSRPLYRPGLRVTYHVPFVGDANLFDCQPSTHTLNPPRADVGGNELRFWYDRTDNDVAATKARFDEELREVQKYLGWMAADLTTFNSGLTVYARSRVQERRGRLEKTKAGLEALGLPVRKEPRGSPSGAPPQPGGPSRAAPNARPTYDVALSFAGENRAYVERVAEGLKQAGMNVFYDKFETAAMWGKNLVDYLADIYQHRSRFVVMFISKPYVEKAFPTHERQHAQARALMAREEYILPARFDETEVPGLAPTVGYADLRVLSPEKLTELILTKMGRRSGSTPSTAS
jgi:TIR domain